MLLEVFDVQQLEPEPPRIEVTGIGIGDGDFRNVEVEPVVLVSDASAYSMVVLLDGAAFSAGDRVTTEGPHVLLVEAQDVFGNSAMVSIRFVVDKTPPALTLSGPADGSVNAASQTLAWASTDASPVVTTGTLDGAAITSGTVVATEGDFVWTVRAEDAAGNATTETRRFALDLTAPIVVLDAPANAPASERSPRYEREYPYPPPPSDRSRRPPPPPPGAIRSPEPSGRTQMCPHTFASTRNGSASPRCATPRRPRIDLRPRRRLSGCRSTSALDMAVKVARSQCP